MIALSLLSCIASLRRTFPLNFIALFFITSIFSIGTSVSCVYSSIENVYTAAYLTAGLFILLTALAYWNVVSLSSIKPNNKSNLTKFKFLLSLIYPILVRHFAGHRLSFLL